MRGKWDDATDVTGIGVVFKEWGIGAVVAGVAERGCPLVSGTVSWGGRGRASE